MPRMKIHQLETQEACTHEVSPATIFHMVMIVTMKNAKYDVVNSLHAD